MKQDSFIERRHADPKYSLCAYITGVTMPDGKAHWIVEIDHLIAPMGDNIDAAGILERAAEVLRDA